MSIRTCICGQDKRLGWSKGQVVSGLIGEVIVLVGIVAIVVINLTDKEAIVHDDLLLGLMVAFILFQIGQYFHHYLGRREHKHSKRCARRFALYQTTYMSG
jgi:hypothetical protein